MTKLEGHCWSFLFVLLKFHLTRYWGTEPWDAAFEERHRLLMGELRRGIES